MESNDVRTVTPSASGSPIVPANARATAAQPHADIPLPIARGDEERSAPHPAMTTDRMISGIDLIDFGAGGLMPDHVYLVKGPSGMGKTLLGLQFLARGLEYGETGILITSQKPEHVLAQARAIGFPLDEATRRQQLTILNPSNRYFDLVESPADVDAIVEELSDYARLIGARRIVIDPIFALVNTQYSSHYSLTLTQSLVNALEEISATILLVAAGEDNVETNGVVRVLEEHAFGILTLQQDLVTGGRLMRLSNLRYASNENLSAHYRILNGRGLINYRGGDEQVGDVTKPWEVTNEVNRKVMLVGASPETARRVRETLGDTYTVEAEADLRRGLERVKQDAPGLVLVTPQRSVAAISAILELAQTSTSSIAFLSPSANRQSDKVLYLRAGADDFITEPFTPAELRARVDALIRRSGRRLKIRDTAAATVSVDELAAVMNQKETLPANRNRAVLRLRGDSVEFEPEFDDRMRRNVETVAKLDTPFAVYWIKAEKEDRSLNKALAQLCRQEDILCHNRNGEFVAILTATDDAGVRGFENRLEEKLGDSLQNARRGFTLHNADAAA